MTRWRQKQRTVEAWRHELEAKPPNWMVAEVRARRIQFVNGPQPYFLLDGHAMARLGDWIILNPSGALAACRHDVFTAQYEPDTP